MTMSEFSNSQGEKDFANPEAVMLRCSRKENIQLLCAVTVYDLNYPSYKLLLNYSAPVVCSIDLDLFHLHGPYQFT